MATSSSTHTVWGVQKGGIPWRRHADQMVTGSADCLWHNSDRAEIIDGDHGAEPDLGTKTSPGSIRNSGGHTHVNPSLVKGGVT